MLPGPVFNVELLTLARRGRYFLLRTVYGLLLLLLIVQNDPTGRWGVSETGEISIQAMASLGQALFATFAATQSVVVLLITPALVAGVIADERRRKTLDYLLSSQLSSAEIVLGKLFARVLHVGVFLAMGLPIVVMLSFFGGVDPNAVLLFFAATASTVFFLAAVSILVSTFARRPRDAVISVYMLEMIWLFGPSLATSIFPAIGGAWQDAFAWVRPVVDWVGWSSPLHVLTRSPVMYTSGPNAIFEWVLWMIGLQVAYGSGCVVVALFWLRPGFRREGAREGRLARVLNWRVRLLRRPACGDDPMVWKEMHCARSSPMTRAIAGLALVIVVLLAGYPMFYLTGEAWRELATWGYGSGNYGAAHARAELNGFLRFLMTLLAGFMLVWVASAAASGLSSEREEDTWVSLIATPLRAGEIVRAKMIGAFWSLRLPLAIWLGFLLVGLVLGAVHPLGAVGVTLATATYLCFGCALGLFCSLRARTSTRAVAATIATLLLLNGVYMIVLIPFRIESPLWGAGVTPYVEALSLLSYNDLDSLSWPQYHHEPDMVLMCIVSVVLYAVGALVLTAMTVLTFDDVIDRPGPGRDGPELRPVGVKVKANLAEVAGEEISPSG